MVPSQQQLAALFGGHPDRAEMPHPVTDPSTRRCVARWARVRSNRPRPIIKPMHFVVALGYNPVELPAGGHACEYVDDDGNVFFERRADERYQGMLILHGLAHRLLGRPHRESDAWLLAGELALPSYLALMANTVVEATAIQPHVPSWFLLCQINQAQVTHNQSKRLAF